MRIPSLDTRWLLGSIFGFVVLGLTACSFMDARVSAQTYLLDPGNPPTAIQRVNGSAAVQFVTVSSPYASGDFKYRITDSDWETDAYNRFLTSPQEMMTGVIRAWLEKSRAFSSVVIPGSGLIADYQVQCDVTELVIDFRDASAPMAVVSMEFLVKRHVKNGLPEVVLSKSYRATAPVHARTPAAFVDAWNVALRENLISFSEGLKSL